MYTILIVEDDATIARLTEQALTQWGYRAVCVTDFQHVDALFAATSPQLVLMDVSLPFFNGFYWCARLREHSRVPILFLTSHTQQSDLITAVSLGADDYICKPFSMDVLVAKIQALLRRAYDYAGGEAPLLVDGALLDASAAVLHAPAGDLPLTRNELRILLTLLHHKGAVVSRQALMKALWDDDVYVDDNTLTVNMARLRKRLEAAGLPDVIETRKGLGYALRA